MRVQKKRKTRANTGWSSAQRYPGEGVSAKGCLQSSGRCAVLWRGDSCNSPLSLFLIPHSLIKYKVSFSTEKFSQKLCAKWSAVWIDFHKNWATWHLNGNLAFSVGCPRTEDDSCRAGLDSAISVSISLVTVNLFLKLNPLRKPINWVSESALLAGSRH